LLLLLLLLLLAVVDNAAGTTLTLAPASSTADFPHIAVAVGRLDGSVSLVSTGVSLLQQQQQQDAKNTRYLICLTLAMF